MKQTVGPQGQEALSAEWALQEMQALSERIDATRKITAAALAAAVAALIASVIAIIL